MNLCNYAKVILARSTKEPETLKWWNDQPNKENKILVHVPNHSQNINVRARYENYHAFMHSYPKMHIPLQEFKSRIPRLQNYLSNAKYWKNNNKTGEKSIFLEKHNLLNWCKLSEAEKKRHKKENCEKCTSEIFYASLHKYTTPSTIEVSNLCEELTKKVCENSKAKNVTKATKILHTLEPFIEHKLDMNIKETACKLYDLTKKLTSDEKQKRIHTIVSKSTERIAKILNKENEEINFLASNKSYNEYERERLHTFFESKSKAKKNLAKRFKDESERKLKKRSSVGNLSKYTFNKEEFLNELKDHPKTVPINWNEWSRKYRVKNVQGIQPANGGQVLIEFAKSQGIDVFNYNTEKRMSGRDYFRRVRRSRHLITKRLRVPVPKSAKKKLKQKYKTEN
ncbi:unnamed protein product [Mytilus edulis]|uniref:Uncharacterized protein n=1 Tax=Mytilus edulis TaxID=6550 RepID=A0A8S3S589_MYTED|nr:unnamed protein product [Mytilus edulis]